MKPEEKAFAGLDKDQRDRLIKKVAGLNSEADANAYLQGVVDGRDLERPRGQLPFGIKPRG